MKITIHDLLWLINHDKAPKKIKYSDIVLEYNEEIEDYNYYDGKGLFEYKFETSTPFLDDEVEIIEEEPKPMTKESSETLGYACGEIKKCFENGWNKSLENKSPIEESKKIEKIEIYEDEDGHYFYNNRYEKIYIKCNEIDFMVDKFNELIDEINNLKKEI